MLWRVGSLRLCLQVSVLRSVSILCNSTVDALLHRMHNHVSVLSILFVLQNLPKRLKSTPG